MRLTDVISVTNILTLIKKKFNLPHSFSLGGRDLGPDEKVRLKDSGR